MKVLGIDPGTRYMGYGVVEMRGNAFGAHDYGTIRAVRKKKFPLRLKYLYDHLQEVLERNEVEVMAIEEVYFDKNFKSAVKLGESRGVAILCAAQHDLPVYEYSAAVIKKAVTGNGRASKEQVEHMVKILLNLQVDFKRDDTTDGLAIALCHLHRHRPGIKGF